jgi:hypothetical protein
MSESLTPFAQTMGYVAATAGLFALGAYLDRDVWIADAIANGVPAEYEAVQITSTPPRTFRDFARKNAAAWSEAET